ncbi:hypothetical protein [Pseudomonas sp. SC3(2021)]|uniref:hypothetical protein n=1 Tax=Pseudomonas sp. SC3(2021) TaxID=2871493 RepID=UPI001C9D9A5D|nr:hypothetical protein [Pseudomonas sp. SC3(2021)]
MSFEPQAAREKTQKLAACDLQLAAASFTVRALLIRPSLQIRQCSMGGLILSGDVFSIAVFFEEVK